MSVGRYGSLPRVCGRYKPLLHPPPPPPPLREPDPLRAQRFIANCCPYLAFSDLDGRATLPSSLLSMPLALCFIVNCCPYLAFGDLDGRALLPVPLVVVAAVVSSAGLVLEKAGQPQAAKVGEHLSTPYEHNPHKHIRQTARPVTAVV